MRAVAEISVTSGSLAEDPALENHCAPQGPFLETLRGQKKLMQIAGTSNGNNSSFQLWRQDNHPIEIFTPKVIHQKLDYIHNNPVEAGFVASPEDYLYSSAKDYYGLPTIIFPEIILLQPLVM